MALHVIAGPTIAAGQSLSNAVNCSLGQIVRVIMPAEWTAAALSFQLSPDNMNYNDLFHVQDTIGSFPSYEVVLPAVVAGTAVIMPPTTGSFISWVKFRSGTRAAPVVQKATRTFGLVLNVPDTAPSPPVVASARAYEMVGGDYHGITQRLPAAAAGASCAIQIYAQSANRNLGILIAQPADMAETSDISGSSVFYDLSAGTVAANYVWGSGSNFQPFTNTAIVAAGNGWWKCTATIVPPAGVDLVLWITLDNNQPADAGGAYPGDGVSYAQLYQPSLSIAGGQNILLSADDLTNIVWASRGAWVQTAPSDALPTG